MEFVTFSPNTKWLEPGNSGGGTPRGSVMLEALCYKSEGRGLETQWGDFFLPNLPNLSGHTMPCGPLSL
jgi:hypothetical protein